MGEPTLIEIRKEMCRLMERNFEGRSLPPTTIDTFLARAFYNGAKAAWREATEELASLSQQGRKQEK